MPDKEFLYLVLDTVELRHETGCLCRDCRADLFFDVMAENGQLRQAIKVAADQIDTAVARADFDNTPIAKRAMYAIERAKVALAPVLLGYLPEFKRRDDKLFAITDKAQFLSVKENEPILTNNAPPVGSKRPGSKFGHYSNNRRSPYETDEERSRLLGDAIGERVEYYKEIEVNQDKACSFIKSKIQEGRCLKNRTSNP